MVQSRPTFPKTCMSSHSNPFRFCPLTNFFFIKQSHEAYWKLFVALWSYSSPGEGRLSPKLKIIWMMLIDHEARKPSSATKLNSFVIGSYRSFAAHIRNSNFNPWISLALSFAKIFQIGLCYPLCKNINKLNVRIKMIIGTLSWGI